MSQKLKVSEDTLADERGRLPARLSIVARDTPMRCPGVEMVGASEADADGWRTYDVTLYAGIDPADVLQCLTEQGITLRRFDRNWTSLHQAFIPLASNQSVTEGRPQHPAYGST